VSTKDAITNRSVLSLGGKLIFSETVFAVRIIPLIKVWSEKPS
jgi:hypothetical protein